MQLFFLMISILSLVNIVTLQARVQSALTQAAQTISMYSYVLEVTNAGNILATVDTSATRVYTEVDTFQSEINGILDGLSGLDIDTATESADSLTAHAGSLGEEIAEDPKAMMQMLMQTALDASSDYIFSKLVTSLMGRYLSNGEMTGDEYLRSVNVVGGLSEGFDFMIASTDGTNLIDENGDIQIVVKYNVEYTFGILPLPFGPTLEITQAAKTKLWLGGAGDGYKD
ncbi:MAG: hypothetical protein R3Y54_12290 [Eubacteriales bacterium]